MLLLVLVLSTFIRLLISREHKHPPQLYGEKLPERQYVGHVDDDLVHAVIHPYSNEWNYTFRPYENVHGVKDLLTPSPMHFYFRCVDGVARIYFTVEDLQFKPLSNQPMGSELKMPLNLFKDRIKLNIDQKETSYNVWHGGADVQVDVSHKPRRSYLHVQLTGWTQYTAFPMNRCVRSSWYGRQETRYLSQSLRYRYPRNETVRMALKNTTWFVGNGTTGWIDPLVLQNKIPPHDPLYSTNEIVVHMHTFDLNIVDTGSSVQNKYLIEGIAKHMIYHRCALKVSKYEVVIQDDHLEQYMANKHLAQFVKEGWLVFLIKRYRPARISYRNCNWQGLYENMALLRYWRSKKHVMFWNADEYLVYNRSFTPETFRNTVIRSAVTGFRRYPTFCVTSNSMFTTSSCKDGKQEVIDFSLNDNTYALGEKLRDLKLIVNPDFVGCMIMHWAGCGTGMGDGEKLHYRSVDQVNRLPNSSAYIAHFENFFDTRWRRNQYHHRWIFEKLDRTIDKREFPVVTKCDPKKLWKFDANI